MSSQTLRRQIERIQTTLEVMTPKPPPTIKILRDPDPAIGGDNLLSFLLEVREAKKSNDLVFVACHKWSDARVDQTIDGVSYFKDDFAALCHKMSLTFTGDIREFALACCGNVVVPAQPEFSASCIV